ncbi:MAG: ABC transporter substrate-binding protein [Chloroflexi bacterium]|nr:ABC transporter substrate-binding protein [Chloroflexota bacterium]
MAATRLSMLASFVIVLILLLSCAPAAAPVAKLPSPTSAPVAQATAAPAASPAAPTPSPKPAADQPRYGGVLTKANYEDPPSFDLQQEQTAPAALVLFNVYQGLVRLHPLEHDKIVPELAEKWELGPDGTTYTFKFTKGIRWHDGKPFTMDDITYSLDRMANPKAYKIISPRGEGLLAAMQSAEIVDESTIKIVTKFPSASFMLNIATGWVAVEPKHILVAKGHMKEDLVGTGPFRLKEAIPNISIEMVKNSDYHVKGLPYLDGVKIYTIKADSTRFAAFRTGQVKMTAQGSRSMTPAQAEVVRKDMADLAAVYEHSAMSRYGLIINHEKEPWGDVRVRKAVDLAFDRQAAQRVNGKGALGTTFDPLGTWGMRESEAIKLPGLRQPKDDDVAAAKKLMTDAGLSGGFTTVLIFPAGGAQEQQAVVAKDQLAKLGINAELQRVESAVLISRFKQRSFEIISYSFADSSGDPDETLYSFYASGGGSNYGNFSNKDIDQLIEKQARTIDEKARRALLADIDKKLMELVPRVITVWDTRQTGAWKEIRNFRPGPGSQAPSKLDQVWLAK